MEAGGGGDGGLGGVGGAAPPIGDDTAGAADNGDEGDDVPRVHNGVEADIGQAGGEEQVAVTIAPSAVEPDGAHEGVAGGAVLVAGEVEGIAGEEGGLSEGGRVADTNGAVIERGGVAIADHELTEDGLVNAAENRLAAVKEGEEGPKEGHAGDEGLGAVDGVEHPHPLGVGAIGAELFADDAVGGVTLGDKAAHKLLRAAIGRGDRGVVALKVNGEGGIGEERGDEVAAGARELAHEGQVGTGIAHGTEYGGGGRDLPNSFSRARVAGGDAVGYGKLYEDSG